MKIIKPTRLINSPIFAFLLFIILIIFKVLIIEFNTGPTLFYDELLFLEHSRNLLNNEPVTSSLYPPAYPIFLVPAIISNHNWYEYVILINIVISSSIIFPVWLLGKKILTPILNLISTLLVFLNPYNIAYPGYILSENLYLPIFLFAVYLSISLYNKSKIKQLLFGVFLGFCLLTKYIFLPSALFFIALWGYQEFFLDSKKENALKRAKNTLHKITIVTSGFVIAVTPWILYVYFVLKQPTHNALGLGISGIKALNSVSLSSIILWISSYISFTFISIFFFISTLLLFSVLTIIKKIKLNRNERTMVFTVIFLTVGHVMVATQHSWGASYNYPNPQYLIGRYLTPTIPLIVIISLFAYHKIYNLKKLNFFVLLFINIVSGLLIYFSYEILYKGLWFSLPNYFARNIFNSPNSYQYSLLNPSILISIAIIPSIHLFLRRIIKKELIFLPFIILLLTQIFTIPKFIKLTNDFRSWGIHGRIITPIIKEVVANRNTDINFSSDSYYFSKPNNFYHLFLVWGLTASEIKKVHIFEFNKKYPTYYFSSENLPYKIIINYSNNNRNYNLYYIDNEVSQKVYNQTLEYPSKSVKK